MTFNLPFLVTPSVIAKNNIVFSEEAYNTLLMKIVDKNRKFYFYENFDIAQRAIDYKASRVSMASGKLFFIDKNMCTLVPSKQSQWINFVKDHTDDFSIGLNFATNFQEQIVEGKKVLVAGPHLEIINFYIIPKVENAFYAR